MTTAAGTGAAGGPRSRVVLHVGSPKSGTTFLQEALWLHRDALLEQGVQCPGQRQRDMFLAALEIRDSAGQWGLDADQVTGRWEALCQQARAFPGTTIMSHELLGAATREQITEAMTHLRGVDVDVVFTARDLARQAVSEWQERVKNGSKGDFAHFATGLSDQARRDHLQGLFWRNHHLIAVLSRWGRGLTPDRVHVVTGPPSGADPRELWTRFARAAGFDPAGLDPVSPDLAANSTLGITEIKILREVNRLLDGRIRQPAYAKVVKRHLGQDLLTRFDSPRPVCPRGLAAELTPLTERWNAKVVERGYRVHGSLSELLPKLDPVATGASLDPDDVDAVQQAEVSAAVIADLLVELDEARTELQDRADAAARTITGRLRGGTRRVVGRLRASRRSTVTP